MDYTFPELDEKSNSELEDIENMVRSKLEEAKRKRWQKIGRILFYQRALREEEAR